MPLNSLGKYSAIGVSRYPGFLDSVSDYDAATKIITIPNLDNWLVTNYEDGLVVVTAGAGIDKVSTIDAISTGNNTIVCDTVLSGLSAGDEVAILPKPDAWACLQSESLKETPNWDETKCNEDWETTQRDVTGVDIGGDITIWLSENCDVNAIFLEKIFGYSNTTTSKEYVYLPAPEGYSPDGTSDFALPGVCVYLQRGNEVSRTAYAGMKVNSARIEQPASPGLATMTLTFAGGFAIKEIDGVGKTWPSSFFTPATGLRPARYSFRHLVVQKNSTPKRYAESARIDITRTQTTDKTLGEIYNKYPIASEFTVGGEVVQWFESDEELDEWRGGHAKFIQPERQDELTFVWTGTQNPGTSLTFRFFNVDWKDSSEPIVNGRIKETLTFGALYDGTTHSSECVYVKANVTTVMDTPYNPP